MSGTICKHAWVILYSVDYPDCDHNWPDWNSLRSNIEQIPKKNWQVILDVAKAVTELNFLNDFCVAFALNQ